MVETKHHCLSLYIYWQAWGVNFRIPGIGFFAGKLLRFFNFDLILLIERSYILLSNIKWKSEKAVADFSRDTAEFVNVEGDHGKK